MNIIQKLILRMRVWKNWRTYIQKSLFYKLQVLLGLKTNELFQAMLKEEERSNQ